MADPNLATKAPESDAAETVVAGDATKGPTMGEHCVTDRPTPSGLASTGEITKLGDVDVYVSKPSEYPHAPSRLLLLLTGGTGLKSVNNQIQADRFAAEGGFVVVMPDLFGGDTAPNSAPVTTEEEGAGSGGSGAGAAEIHAPSFLEQFKLKAAEAAKSFMIDMWLARHTEEKVMPILRRVIEACRDEFADAVSNGDGIYAVGYCFGGRYVLLLASDEKPAAPPQHSGGGPLSAVAGWATGHAGQSRPSDEEEAAPMAGNRDSTGGPLIKAGALAHGTLVSRDDFLGVKAPISMVCVENDPLFPDEVRMAGEDRLAGNDVEHEVRVYPGVPHGFAVVGEYEDATIKEAQEQAFDQMLSWLKRH